ncbi:MAG: ABC transporter ATP-binding protein [Bacteroidia bacterium]
MPIIVIDQIHKHYKLGNYTVRALDGMSFTVEKGEFVAIIGPSGSGKSTLMHILGCLDTPTSGRYILGGVEVQSMEDEALAYVRNYQVGFIFQTFNLLPRYTALENVELPLIYRGMRSKERRQRAVQALEAVGLADRLHHKPSELSGGQRQRVAIARALVTQPTILLADEPTGNLDSVTSHEIMQLFLDLHRQGNTLIVVTHEPDIAAYAHRVISLKDGKIASDTRK